MSLASNIHELLLGGSTGTYSYTINNSLRFRSSASAYLSRTPASASNRTTWTISFWMKRGVLEAGQNLFGCTTDGYNVNYFSLYSGGGNTLRFENVTAGVTVFAGNITTQVFRDPSAWYHVVLAVDTTQSTSSNRLKFYINGSQVTAWSQTSYPTQNASTLVNSTIPHQLSTNSGLSPFDGYLAEVNFIDGLALDASYFGATNSTTGTWTPKAYSGSYGTNGFYLPFSDTSGLTSGSNTGIGKDFSGNGNYFNSSNISLTAGSTYDAMLDSPTPKSTTVGNYAVLNPLSIGSASSLNSGNLNFTSSSASGYWYQSIILSNFAVSSGKWYWEQSLTSTGGSYRMSFGVSNPAVSVSTGSGGNPSYAYWGYDGSKFVNGVNSSYGAAWGVGDIIGTALDLDTGQITFYKNGVSQGVAATGVSGSFIVNNSTGESGQTHTGWANFGQRPFAYTPPSGYKALNTYNLSTPSIVDGSKQFAASLYTGTGSSLSVSGANFTPGMVWVKSRSAATDHALYDVIRGTQARLESNTTDTEVTSDNGVTAFNSTGFTVGTLAQVNTSSATYVGWQWKANGTAVTNTDGSITSSVSANQTAGFSVVTYTGNGVAGATVGHGLGIAPSMVITKPRTAQTVNGGWGVYHVALGATKYLNLNLTDAAGTVIGAWNNTAPTSSVFSVGTFQIVNTASSLYVAYCFAAIPGYSAFGSYTGNGSTNGPFVFTGFLPKFVLIKDTTNVNDWFVMDTVRGTYNTILQYLSPNKTTAEGSDLGGFDILSNGFKVRQAGALNNNNATLIYAAFAQNPFQYSLAR